MSPLKLGRGLWTLDARIACSTSNKSIICVNVSNTELLTQGTSLELLWQTPEMVLFSITHVAIKLDIWKLTRIFRNDLSILLLITRQRMETQVDNIPPPLMRSAHINFPSVLVFPKSHITSICTENSVMIVQIRSA